MPLNCNHYRYCVVCLVRNVNMYSFNDPTLSKMYSKLIDKKVNVNEDQNLCLECIIQLRKFVQFRKKCLRTLQILGNIKDFSLVTKMKIDKIDREKFNLTSPLSVTPPKIDMYDLWIKEASDSVTCEEIKIEFESFQSKDSKLDSSRVFESAKNKTYPKITDSSNVKVEKQDPALNAMKHDGVLDSNSSNDNVDNHICNENESCSSDSEFNTNPKEKFKVFLNNTEAKPVKRDRKKIKIKTAKIPKTVDANKKYEKRNLEGCISVISMTHEEAVAEILLRKEKNNYKNSIYKCEICYKGFHYDNTYQNHMKTHSVDVGKFECEYCHTRFKTKLVIFKHIENSHRKKHVCKICPYICFNSTQARGHVRLHFGQKYKCPDCGREFRMINTLSRHRRVYHHTGVSCELCGESLGSDVGLVFHKRAMHPQEENKFEGPKCEECNVHFDSLLAWKRHMVLSKKHSVGNGCEICGEIFPDQSALKDHRKSNHYKKKINNTLNNRESSLCNKCPVCSIQIFTRQDYVSHLKNDHPDSEVTKLNMGMNKTRFMCEVCGKVLKCNTTLRQHQRIHTGERPYKCDVCGKGFRDPDTCAAHKLIHTKRTRLKCDTCQKQYFTKASVTKHIMISHLDIKRYSCSVCSKAYLHKCEVTHHMKYKHEGVPWPKRIRNKRSKTNVQIPNSN